MIKREEVSKLGCLRHRWVKLKSLNPLIPLEITFIEVCENCGILRIPPPHIMFWKTIKEKKGGE